MWAERVASIDELAVAQRLRAEPGFAWLDSNRSEARDGRYSFLSAWPSDEIRVEYGDGAPFDSLMAVRLRGSLQQEGIDVPLFMLTGLPSLLEITAYIIQFEAFYL